MQIRCPSCQALLDYSGPAPKFCSNCGGSLADSATAPDLMQTAEFHRDSTSARAGQPVPFSIPDRLGGYRLIRELGRGGMGVVYEAEQDATGRRVAIKLLADNVSRNESAVARFLQEAKFAAAFSHPRSTFVYEAGEAEGLFYIVMELMPGGTLKDIVDKEGRLTANRAVDATLDVIDGLAAAHRAGVIHRDVKPSNCFLDTEGRVKVGDYGLSKSLVIDAALTRTGAFMGTPQFAAPEQIRGETIDERTDVYAVGATLFYLLAAEAPFQGDAARVIAGIAAETAPTLSDKGVTVPAELERIVAQALAKDPDQRPASLDQLRARLAPFASGGSSIADLGRRLAAYFVDTTLVAITSGIAVSFGIGMWVIVTRPGTDPGSQSVQVGASLLMWVILVAYFAVLEGRWGRALGKQLMGLRVVNMYGQSPGLLRASLRACVMPGFVWFVGRVLELLLDSNIAPTGEELNTIDRAEMLRAILFAQLYPLLGWLMSLLLLTTMKLQNGYRGTHELLSGTRVVRHGVATAGKQSSVAITLPEVLDEAPPIPGSYKILGGFGAAEQRTVFQARDESLGRLVWLVRGGQPQSPQRSSLARPTRLHWLRGGEDEGLRWDAFEAVQGSPLAAVARRRGGLTWPHARLALLDLADELLAAESDQTLPEPLSLEQVWLDKSRRVKLLDSPLEPARGATFSGPARAAELFAAAIPGCCSQRVLPAPVQEFVRQSGERLQQPGGLRWARERLQTLTDRAGDLTWDERLGILAVSSGTELTIFYTIVSCLVWLVASAGLPSIQTVLVPILAGAGVCAAMGFGFRGGPVFRFAGVDVVRSGGRPAGRLRCAWRNLVAWLPALALYTSTLWFVLFSVTMRSGSTGASTPDAFALLGTALLVLLGTVAHLGGVLIAVLSPQRGLQDLLSGCYLVSR